MLESLHIENVAVIERADVNFHDRLNVLTGETGAGKSILIDAIGAVLGERVSRDLVRTGCEQAVVFATFSHISENVLKMLSDGGYTLEEDTLLIQRIIRADGKSSCRIGGRPATVGFLRDVGRALVNIHGQHENQSLLDPSRHLEYLERLGDFSSIRKTYEEVYQKYCDVSRQIKKLNMAEEERQQKIDMLQFRIHELEAAQLVAGEEQKLIEKRDFYRHSDKIAGYLRKVNGILNGDDDGGAVSAVETAAEALRHAGGLVSSLTDLSARLDSAMYELEALGSEIGVVADEMVFDEKDRAETENRLDLLYRLSRKYNTDSAGMLELLETAKTELSAIEDADATVQKLLLEQAKLRDETIAAAGELTDARKKTGAQFAEKVAKEMAFLDMPYVQLEVSVTPVPLTALGGDKVEFLISVNPGEPAKPLANIASGGELSRMMLAIKSVMAQVDDIDTLIFDEIDTGISGHAAVKVGIKLRQTADYRQILCVTHLAQIAARAHHHLLISKAVVDDRTCTSVYSLSAGESEKELARIIGGGITEATLHAAKEMRLEGQQ